MQEPNPEHSREQPDPGPPSNRRATPILTAAAAVCAGVIAVGCGGGDDSEGAAATTGDTPCEQVELPPEKEVDLRRPRARTPDATAVRFETSCGEFTVALDVRRAPRTAASFEYLAEEGVYDRTPIHRVASTIGIQGGDPLGNGFGGPGYYIDERPPRALSYTEGTVAMAKTDADPIGRSGSQFFIVTVADAGLPADYALVGRVSDGMDTVHAIAELAPPEGDGPPAMPVVVERAQPVGG